MTIDINFVDAAKLEIVIFDYLWIGWNAGWCNDSSLLVGASTIVVVSSLGLMNVLIILVICLTAFLR
jgi:hypothetical protein